MNKDKKLIPELRFPEFLNNKEWAEMTLGNIGEFIGGGTPDTSKSEYWNGDIQWYTPTEVKDGVLGKSLRTITKVGLNNSSAKLLPKGALLLTTRATIGDIAIANSECTTNQGFQSLVVKDSEINTFWYYWIIQHKNELKRKASGSTFPEIGKNEIVKIKAYRPDKDEQQKIASCLSSLDEVITAHSQKLELLKDHKKGLMQNLFPQEGEKVPKYRFKEFEKDGVWVEKKLGEIGEPLMCKRIFKEQTTTNPNNGIPFYKIGTFGKLADAYISIELYEEFKSKYSFPKKGDILISASGTIGRLVIYDGSPAYFQDSNIVWLGNDEKLVLNEFLYHCYSIVNWQTSDGGVISRLYNSDLKNIDVKFPKNPKEQQKIASCLSSLDDLIKAQAEKIEQLKLHKKGLMQGLFPKIND